MATTTAGEIREHKAKEGNWFMIEMVHSEHASTFEIPFKRGFDVTGLKLHFRKINLHGGDDLTGCILRLDEGSINTPKILVNWRREYRGGADPACIRVEIFRKVLD